MKRLFWVALGATAGVLIVRKLSQAASHVTPDGMADRVFTSAQNVTQAVREFADEVKAGMAERDTQLRQALGIAGDSTENGARGKPAATTVDELFHTHLRGSN